MFIFVFNFFIKGRTISCYNGGTLLYGTSCLCTSSFIGSQCQYFSPCNSQPCSNGATCTALDSVSFICSCPLAFTGNLCQISRSSCFDTNSITCSLLSNKCYSAIIQSIPLYEYCPLTCKQCKKKHLFKFFKFLIILKIKGMDIYNFGTCQDSKPQSYCTQLKNTNLCSVLNFYYPLMCPKTCGMC